MKMKINKDFATDVFDRAEMKKYLPKATYNAIVKAQETGERPSQKDVENFAKGIRKWALGKGVKRYTHRFQPLNNFTAGKMDSLTSVDSNGDAVVKFRGKELTKGEGDASGFPNGGMRQTFEARGITNWDYQSAAFIKDGCLCIPTTFCSYNGAVLDKKTPLLKSMRALNDQAVRLLKLCGINCRSVTSMVGAEQEYFLIDKDKYLARPDLVYTGRTLLGNPPPKGQEMYDGYLRPPTRKTREFWNEADKALWKLGIVAKTEHREVAPCQFELAPCYSAVNNACDQNQIIMETLQSTAEKFNLVCLLHEKPFANLNGSGKHNNWSLLTDDGTNLFEQCCTSKGDAVFTLFTACVIKAVDEYQDLLQLSVSSAGNDCRLGGYEAPPRIISVFLGEVGEAIIKAVNDRRWKLGQDCLPPTPQATDRNRTSPFAYTGNKFEFRTVGSSASLADCNTVLNTVMADALKYFADKLENAADFWTEAQNSVKQTLSEHGKIMFNGNNYSAEWQVEAAKRRLVNLNNACDAAECLSEKQNVDLLVRHGIYTENEIAALQQIYFENYSNTIAIEARTLGEIADRQVAQSARNFVSQLVDTACNKKSLGLDSAYETDLCKKTTELLQELTKRSSAMKKDLEQCAALNGAKEKAHFAADVLIEDLRNVRQIADALEQICPRETWSLPTYGQLLLEN